VDDLAPVIELYHHTVRAGKYDEAYYLAADRLTPNPLYYRFGAYQTIIELLRELFPDGDDNLPRLKKEADQAWVLNELANSYSTSGQPRRAVPMFEAQNEIREKAGDKKNLAIGLGNLAYTAQIQIGELNAAEANLRQRIEICREIKNEFKEAMGHQELGRLHTLIGEFEEAKKELSKVLALFTKLKRVQSKGIVFA